MRKINFYILFLLISLKSFSQVEEQNIIETKPIKNQVGIGISRFINSAFSSDVNAYSVEYRCIVSQKNALRAGLSYEKTSDDSGITLLGLKLGFDKNLRSFDKWNFYYGSDIFSTYSNFKNLNKDEYIIGLSILLGIQYKISKNFSLSIEPNLFIKEDIFVDNATFLKNKISKTTSSGLGKLGYIQVNFHF